MNSTRKEKSKTERSVFTRETLGVVLVLFTTVCLVCLITGEKVFSAPGKYISDFLFGAFGYFAYALTAWGEVAGIFLITDKKTGFSAKRKALITLAFIALAAFLHILSMGDNGGAGYTFAEYISSAYEKGAGGITAASAGGVCTAVIAFPFLKIMQFTGGLVVVGALFALCAYFAIADFVKSGKAKTEPREKKLRSSYSPEEEIPVNPVISGVKEYPAEGVRFEEKRSDQRLFVSNPEDFKLKTRREMAKSDKVSGIKLDFEKNGLGVGKSAESYSGSYKDDLQKKIEYVKTPPKLDLNSDKTVKKYAGETKVSAQIKPSFAVSAGAGAGAKGNAGSAPIPFREHDGNNAAANDAARRSASFADRYASGRTTAQSGEVANGGYFAGKTSYGAGVAEVNKSATATAGGAENAAAEKGAAQEVKPNPAEKPANYKPTLAERLKAAEEAKKAAETAGISSPDRGERTSGAFGGAFTENSSENRVASRTEGRASRISEIRSEEGSAENLGERKDGGEQPRDIFAEKSAGIKDISERSERTSAADMGGGIDRTERTERAERASALFGEDFDNKKEQNDLPNENSARFSSRTGERGKSARAFFEDDSEDAGVSSVIREPRANRILFGDEKKNSAEKESFTSRVSADGNLSARNAATGVPAADKNGARNSFGTDDFSSAKEEPEKKEKVQPPINRKYVRPPLDLLEAHSAPVNAPKEDHEGRMEVIKQTLEEFHINAIPQSYVQGPSITRYEIMMPAGVSVRKVLGYDDDLRMRLASKSGVRIEAPIPGKNLVGIEVANKTPIPVGIREVLEGAAGKPEKTGALTFAIGKNIVGEAITDNLAKGPHYLVAGATGSGKSVCLNVMIVSLIMRYSPEELRLILIDPKRVGFRCYEHLPHLMIDEIVTEPQKAIAVLQWAYNEMERRYDVFAACTENVVSDMEGYNKMVASDTVPKMPRIVIIVDELADLMETCKKDMEARIRALAQKARAAGVHLVLATQRPSVDIVTGTIKANLPSRIALKVMNFADSQTILAQGGAEKLLGNGDMLYKNSSMSEFERYQGAWISDREINAVVKYIIEHNAAYFDDELQEFLDKSVRPKESEAMTSDDGGEEDGDGGVNEFFLKALWLAVNSGTVSISQLQRRFQIGYARAGGLVDKMERMGFVSGNEGSKARRVLISREEFIEKFGEMSDSY